MILDDLKYNSLFEIKKQYNYIINNSPFANIYNKVFHYLFILYQNFEIKILISFNEP